MKGGHKVAEFVHLHLHSEYSLLDGACRVREIPRAAKAAGQTAVAITDHGVMYGAVEFFRACVAEGIRPIIGCEVYVAPRSRFRKEGKQDSSGAHLILLCKNEVGYRNLIAMVSDSFTQGFYSKPRIDMELLEKHHEGLIALSACLAGAIPQAILVGDLRGAEEIALRMKRLFGADFYLELQDHGLSDEKTVCRALAMLSEKTGIPLVATNDVHYLKKTDAEIQATLMCIQTNRVITDGRPIGFETDEFYFKSTEEMQALFSAYPGAVERSARIAEQCNFSFEFGKTKLPTFHIEGGLSHREYLARMAREGFERRVARGDITFAHGKREGYLERIEYELSVIDRMGYNGYYLIVQDFIAHAKRAGIPVGPGRGSGAGSMVAYCVGITDIDPFCFGLLFERFLNPERVSLPDFDTDFCYERREEVIAYVRERYGADHVAQIVTFGTMAARAAVRDVGRAMGMPYGEVDRIVRLIPHALNMTIAEALKKKELLEKYQSSDAVKKLLDTAMALEGMPRHASTHAAGIVITDEPLSHYVPLSVNGDSPVTQFDMDTVAELGLVKFDILGLRYLTIIADAEREIQKASPNFAITTIPLDDASSYALLAEGRTAGLFQLESGGMKQLLQQMKPRSIYDITAAVSLYRPGPMDSIPHYLACRDGRERVVYEAKELAPILDDTYGCIVYQEQVMQVFRTLAGYSYARADLVRRAMAKKKSEVLKAERHDFIEGAAAHGIEREVADRIFSNMESFASYAFNKSHAAAYAVLAYRTTYLMAHYPRQYLAALLTSVLGDLPKMGEYMAVCHKNGIEVLPPDINESLATFSVSGENIRFGLLAIRNVGRPFVEAILRERKSGRFESFQSFLERMSGAELNRRQVEALIKCGAFDRLGTFRSRLLSSYEKMMDVLAERGRANVTGQIDIFNLGEEAPLTAERFRYPEIPEFGIRELLMLEKESAGMYFSGHLIQDYAASLRALSADPISEILESFGEEADGSVRYYDGKRVTVGGIVTKRVNKTLRSGETMSFVTLEDRYGEIECILFPKILAAVSGLLSAETAVAVTGKLSVKEEESPKILVSSVSILASDAEGGGSRPRPTGSKLYLRVSDLNGEDCRRALRLCAAHPGEVPVIFYDRSLEKYVSAPDHAVSPEEALLGALRGALGAENVILK